MYRKAHPLFLICNTPTHVGSGSDLGVIDLPIQRERHTGFPKFEASSLKGSLREAFERKIDSKTFKSVDAPDTIIHRLFGYDEGSLNESEKKHLIKHFQKEKGKDKDGKPLYEDQNIFAGALGFTDARLLLFPVKSMKGVFAWITCLRALKQFESDMQLAFKDFRIVGLNDRDLNEKDTYLFSSSSNLKISSNLNKIVLEEFTFDISNELNGAVQIELDGQKNNLPDWLSENLFGEVGSYWSEKIKLDIVVLPDDDFKDFVNLSTEVITRTKIDNVTGTVAQGALFTEEYLPAESIMYALTLTAAEFKEKEKNPMKEEAVFKFFNDQLPTVIQIGGNATLGKGIANTKLLKGNKP